MKRHHDLKTLSWEHHEGLVLAFRIERGLHNRSRLDVIRAYVLHSWDEDLTHHFWQEEEVLTAILNRSEEGRRLLQKMLHDHVQFREKIAGLRGHKPNSGDLLKRFAEDLNAHIRFEERILFPFIENAAGSDEMARIGNFLTDQHRHSVPCWEPAFWRQ